MRLSVSLFPQLLLHILPPARTSEDVAPLLRRDNAKMLAEKALHQNNDDEHVTLRPRWLCANRFY